jgi:hypothetical protein
MAVPDTFSAPPLPARRRAIWPLSWPNWLGVLTFGLLLILAALIASWLLRACAPVDPTLNVETLQTPAPPAPPAPPDPTPVLKASLDQVATDGKTLADEKTKLEAALKDKFAACKPIEPPKPPEPPKVEPPKVAAAKPPPPPAATPLPADRWANKDLGMLQGCWQLGRDTESTMTRRGGHRELCSVKAGRICFGQNGTGQRETTSICPTTGQVQCRAPITARFGSNGSLSTTQPVVSCNPSYTMWNGPVNALTCQRQSDTLAICRDRLNFEYEFRRE